jgi:hypothetical protein
MEIEQLKLILETLQGVGHEAGNLAVLYLWLKFAGSAFGYLCAAGVLMGVVGLVYKAIKFAYGEDAYGYFFREMRDQLGTGISGPLSTSERDRTMNAIRQLVAKHKEKQA